MNAVMQKLLAAAGQQLLALFFRQGEVISDTGGSFRDTRFTLSGE